MNRFETQKDKIKLVRSVAEAAFLIVLLVFVLRSLFAVSKYQAYDSADRTVVSGEDKGFLAISYFGVDREGTDSLISTARLNEHLKALSDLGYVTITQQDIVDYYENGKPLPDKVLFLMFEDGRRDTAIFSEKILEKYNYLATILTYAEKFETKDNKFLMPKDLLELKKSTWWELGTNGYRLSYINAYDRYDRFLGELTSREYIALTPYMGRDYNHYLMDYIRDKYGLPAESTAAMKKRISYDYELMRKLYSEEVGEIPMVYVLMHANTGMFGNNEKVSQTNAENMQDLFAVNFNREGYSINTRESSIYDLTRMQPQAYWYTNHLLMRIWDDLAQEDKSTIAFVTGDETAAKDWEVISGAAEFKSEKIVLTSIPEGEGLMKLKNSSSWKNLELTAKLTGNKLGVQTIYLRADENCSNYIAITLQDDQLLVYQNLGGESEELFSADLRTLEDIEPISVEEDNRDALTAELETRAKYSGSVGEWIAYQQEKKKAENLSVKTVEDGAEEYIPELQINDLGNRSMRAVLREDSLQIWIDEKEVASLTVQKQDEGSVYLGSAWSGYGYSQRNIADDVYDGVFESLTIVSADEENTVLYKNVLSGWQKLVKQLDETWNSIISWFVENF